MKGDPAYVQQWRERAERIAEVLNEFSEERWALYAFDPDFQFVDSETRTVLDIGRRTASILEGVHSELRRLRAERDELREALRDAECYLDMEIDHIAKTRQAVRTKYRAILREILDRTEADKKGGSDG